ncbi:MAG: hypothetical protein L0027_04675 [Candidatus Rokubacteria bacterium]|nr:hypothetical protein [Candidatus Rokubacteria bacterium]
MDLLTIRFEPGRPRAPSSVVKVLGPPVGAALVLLAVGAGLVRAGSGWPPRLGAALEVAAVHGGFIAIGAALVLGPGKWLALAGPIACAMALAHLASQAGGWGAVAALLPPALLLRESRRHPELIGIGASPPAGAGAPVGPSLLGLAAGLLLGGHLLLTASLTLGYAPRMGTVDRYLSAISYDVSANALSAEWLFRGVVFSACWRRASFWTATAVATAALLGRYLADPALPRRLEMAAGGIFYLGLVGVACCALRAWSGNLVPGYLCSVAFFAAYRLLAAG